MVDKTYELIPDATKNTFAAVQKVNSKDKILKSQAANIIDTCLKQL